jgi:hypothetical protein
MGGIVKTRRIAALALVSTLVAGASGCFNPFDPRISTQRAETTPAPAPNTAQNVVRLFEWCWKNRGIKEYEEVFTDDYRFQFAETDSAGNAYRDVPYTREDELRSATGLFVGNADHEAASEIQLDFDKTLIPLNDDRPGKDPYWHQSIRTRVDLKVTLDRGAGPEVNEVHGYAKFYLVRGDSAVIPKELVDRGFKPDPNRWWIERWEDETLPAGTAPARAMPLGRGPAVVFGDTLATPVLVTTSFGAVKLKGF